MKNGIAYIVALIAALALMTGSAFAQGASSDPTAAQYGDTASNVSGASGGQARDPGGGLPLTGLEVGVLIAVAVAMGGAGIALRRLSRARYD